LSDSHVLESWDISPAWSEDVTALTHATHRLWIVQKANRTYPIRSGREARRLSTGSLPMPTGRTGRTMPPGDTSGMQRAENPWITGIILTPEHG